MTKVLVAYEHDPADLATVYLAVTPRGSLPSEGAWRPALRDTVNGQRVVWARFETADGIVWLRDRDGERQVRPV
jgi:hypothetical protein